MADNGSMANMENDDTGVVADYLRRLEVAASRLPADRRDELVAQIREHLVAALAETPPGDEAGVRQALDRLGDPEEIVREALVEDGPAQDAPVAGRWTVLRTPVFEMAAVTLLLVGGFAYGAGWIVGVVMTWSSTRWSVLDKVIGTLVWPGGLASLVLLEGVTTGGEVCTYPVEPSAAPSSPAPGVGAPPGDAVPTCETWGFVPPVWVGTTILVILVVAPFVVAFHLLRRARRVPPTTPSTATKHTQRV
jgi:hypothetical protein